MKRLLIAVLLSLSILIGLPATIALADQPDPDSTPTVELNFYRNLLETGDVLLIIYANIPYAATPTAQVGDAYIWRLIDTDNVTELGSDTGYAWTDSGYGYNCYSMYWSAADNITWGELYSIRLSGNPAIFVTPPEYNFPVNLSDYSVLTVTAEVQSDLALRIITIATELDTAWGLGATYSLLLETETGTVLSIYGEAFFRNAIYGLQGLCPYLFRFIIGDIEVTDRTWGDNFTANLSTMYAGTWVATAQAGGAALAGTSYDWMSLLMFAILGIAAVFASMWLAGGDFWAGGIDGAIVLLGGARLGMFEFGILALIVALSWMYVSAKMWSVVR
jgi:hypothetical protein